jgi:hypothetical protein
MIIKNKKTITDFDSISVSIPLDLKTPKDYLSDSDYRLVTDIFTTVNKYKVSNWISEISTTEMQNDVLYLQSLQLDLTMRFSALMAYSESIEEQLKIARAKVRIQSKNLKQQFEEQGDSVSVTLDDLKDISYTKTEAIWLKLEEARIASEFTKFVYYAARDHIAMLDRAIQRLHRFE